MIDAYQIVIMALLASALAGCSSRSPQTKAVVSPPLIPYSLEVQRHALEEKKKLGPPCPRDAVFGGCSALNRMIIDYRWTRKRIEELRP